MSLPQQKCEYSDWQSKRPVLPVDSRVYGHIDLYLFCEYKQINANTGKPTCWFGEGLSDCKVRQNNKGCGGWDKKDPLAGAAGEEASLCVVFQRNVSTAMPDLDSGVGTGLGDRVVFLDRVAYCPLQYALRSPTMNRVEMESSLSSSCSDKNTSVPASAKVRFTSNWQSKRPVLPVDSQSLRSHRPPFILQVTNNSILTPVNPRVGSGKDYKIVKFVRIN